MRESAPLPPGQVEVDDFPRFGVLNFAFRFPAQIERVELAVDGDVAAPARFAAELEALERVEQISDLHCVTTWTKRGLRWGGWLIPPVRWLFRMGLERYEKRNASG